MKRLFATLILLITLVCVAVPPTAAQTSTPTPGPIFGPGYYESNASGVATPSGSWTTSTDAARFSGGSARFTLSVGGQMGFRMWGTVLVIYKSVSTTGAPATICFDVDCRSITFNAGSTADMVPEAFAVSCLSYCNVSITHTGTGSQFIGVDAFAIFANEPTNTPVTPLATWTAQMLTTWTPQPTSQDRGERVLTGGFYEEVDANLNFQGAWTLDLNASYRNGAAYTTTTQSAYLTFTFNGSAASLLIRRNTSGDDLEVCVGSSCSTVDGNASNAFNVSVSISSGQSMDRTVRIRKANNNANPIYIDAVDITVWGTATPTATFTASATFTPTATQTGIATAGATWTPQPQGGDRVIGELRNYAGEMIDDTDPAFAYHGDWDLQLVASTGTRHTTTSQSAYLSFTLVNVTTFTVAFWRDGSSDDVLVCRNITCSTISGAGSPGLFSQNYSTASPESITVTIRKASADSRTLYFEYLTVGYYATATPILPLTEIPQFTQIAPLTQIPYPTVPPYLTAVPQFTAEPQFTQIPHPTPPPYLTAEPQFTQIAPLTQIPYPTPLDTWTPQAAAMIVITVDSNAVIDWNGLLTIFPTLITQVPPTLTPSVTSTPTETFTPSVTPTPTNTPLPVAMEMTLVNPEGTPVASGTVNLQMSAGEAMTNVWLFALTMATLISSLITLRRRRV